MSASAAAPRTSREFGVADRLTVVSLHLGERWLRCARSSSCPIARVSKTRRSATHGQQTSRAEGSLARNLHRDTRRARGELDLALPARACKNLKGHRLYKMMSPTPVTLANPIVCQLGEGPVWDPIRQYLLWIDVARKIVHIGAVKASGHVEQLRQESFLDAIGAVAVAHDGHWLVAGSTHVFRHPAAARDKGLPMVIGPEPRRMNDGKPDPAGRFVVGTLALTGQSHSEVLMRIDDHRVTVIDSDLTLSNGLAWSSDGTVMYSVDTLRRRIYARRYDAESGAVGRRRAIVELEDGLPDGICLDEEEYLWVAVWGTGAVHRYSPQGRLDHIIRVPAPHVTSVAFAGPELDILAITTATQGLTEAQLRSYPLSGQLFTTRPGVRGARVALWNGRLPRDQSLEGANQICPLKRG